MVFCFGSYRIFVRFLGFGVEISEAYVDGGFVVRWFVISGGFFVFEFRFFVCETGLIANFGKCVS